ncbi:MAG: DUF4149 domain-containing protein [Candidatus Eremiobacteraeota bacterium]|nr:DUF4149 domain-containing protein [Candidatus Eremiobacteraeota bacterium]
MIFLIHAARVARTLAVGLWVGAMAGFAFIFAPIAFHVLGATPAFAAIIAATIRVLTAFGAACAVVAIASTYLLGASRPRALAIATALLVMVGLCIVEVAFIVPQMERTALHTSAYSSLHGESSAVYSVVLLLGILSLAAISVREHEN